MKYLSLWLARIEDGFDKLLDRLTTYRLVLYLLILYIAAGAALSLWHKVPFSAAELILSTLCLLAVSRVVNLALAKFLKVPANQESDLITALILALIMAPAASINGYLTLSAAASIAMASKYIVAYKGRHIFNPAATGVFITGLVFHTYASWWVGTKFMIPLVAIGGLLIVKKMKRLQMVLVFGAVYAAYLTAYAPHEHLPQTLWQGIIVGPLIFFATVMLTEPLTSPNTLNQSLAYALLTGFLFSSRQLHWSPEQALLAGNALVFLMAPNRSLMLKFVGSKKEAGEIYSFIFQPTKRLAFAAGQYMEWTIPGVRLDNRGNRRYLTIASSPTENGLAFSVRMPAPKSGFKTALSSLQPGQQVLATQLAGDFILPKDTSLKLAFVAGGIGITPFRSMVKYLIDNQQKRDIKLLYFASSNADFAFSDLFSRARNVGLSTSYIVGRADDSALKSNVPDLQERTFLISGPQGFVANARQILLEQGVEHSRITTDFFPGYN